MHINHLDLALPLLALVLMIGLLKMLRYLLRVRDRASHAPAAGQALTTPASDTPTDNLDPWVRITSRWNRWITWVLPVPVGICILALAAWFLAYLGWGTTWVVDRPLATAGMPPWFGGAEVFIVDIVSGLMTLLLGAGFGVALVLFSHLIGTCLIWPEACGCEDGADKQQGQGH